MTDAIDMANAGEPTFTVAPIEEKPQVADFEALIVDLSTRLEKAQAELTERAGPQYAGLCQFRAADGRVCLTLYADGKIERGEGFPDDDAASVAFFDSMARNLKGHLNNRENRVIAAEAEAGLHRQRAEELVAVNTLLRQHAEKVAGDHLQLRHQVAVAEARATALLEARGT